MTDADFDGFTAELRRLAAVMRYRAAPAELAQITKAYFVALRRFPIGAVILGADHWIATGDRFPKPVQWIDAIPRATAAATVVELSQDERDDYLFAERVRFDRSPCTCVVCRAADVHDKPLRFVPDVEPDGRDARGRIGQRVVVKGHWAHGDELARWYDARANFYDRYLSMFPHPLEMPHV